MKKFISISELDQMQIEHNYVRIVANQLAQAQTREEMAQILMDVSCEALQSSAACLFMLQADGQYEMIAHKGCTPRFQAECQRIPKDILPLVNENNPHEKIFFGSANEFKAAVPVVGDLVDQSARGTIAYTPLVTNGVVVGIFGFSYNKPRDSFTQKEFVLTLANLFSLALERVRLFELESMARKEAENASRVKTEFLANISHEIRTPVGVIQGFADLMIKSGGLTELQMRWLNIISRNSVHLGKLIGDVLDISKIEAEKIAVTAQPFQLTTLIESVFSITNAKAQENGVELDILTRHQDLELVADHNHIRQILVNLIENAIKFSCQRPVQVELYFENDVLVATVTDNGLGIPEEHHEKIFEPFVQVDGASSRSFGGAGLGLSISKRLASAMGGDLFLKKSSPNQGSTFMLRVPCHLYVRQQDDLAGVDMAGLAELRGLKILMVDDAADNRDLVSYLLSEQGACVEVACSGEEGVAMALNDNYDVILMDIQMPKMDGFEAVALLRSKGYVGSVAALTARALSSDKHEATQRGFDDYLTKPIDEAYLIQKVQKLAKIG